MIVDRITNEIMPGQIIPKPFTKTNSVKGWGKRRDQPALIYYIPSRNSNKKPYQKGVTESEFELAYRHLMQTESLTRKWFNENLTDCAAEGPCNFTTIGGIFQLLGIARYVGKGLYVSYSVSRL